MIDAEILKKLQGASIEERISLIETILRSLKHDIRSPARQAIAENRPLRGKVRHYKDPYHIAEVNDD